MPRNAVDVDRFSVRGQGHDLVFVGRVQEAQIFRDLFVEDAQGVGICTSPMRRRSFPIPGNSRS